MEKSILESIRRRDPGLAVDTCELALAVTILLLDVAFADEKISTEEMENIRSILGTHFQLDEQELRDLLE
ncbi:MAG: TerB family tellurite resistance protein, partial [bacterium]